MPTFIFSNIHEAVKRFNPERHKQFAQLRRETHERMEKKLAERLHTNPIPTETELRLGTFLEALEPQVRDAVAEMNGKVYSTNSSGFWGKYEDQQIIERNNAERYE
jgi:hypothetical protein